MSCVHSIYKCVPLVMRNDWQAPSLQSGSSLMQVRPPQNNCTIHTNIYISMYMIRLALVLLQTSDRCYIVQNHIPADAQRVPSMLELTPPRPLLHTRRDPIPSNWITSSSGMRRYTWNSMSDLAGKKMLLQSVFDLKVCFRISRTQETHIIIQAFAHKKYRPVVHDLNMNNLCRNINKAC